MNVKKSVFSIFLTIPLVLALVFGAAAQDTEPQVQQPEVLQAPILASELFTLNVWNTEGEALGQVEGLVVDRQNGSVDYMLLSDAAGIFTVAGELVPVPWNAFAGVVREEVGLVDDDEALTDEVDEGLITDNEYILLNVDFTALEGAPGIDPTEFDGATMEDVFGADWDATIRDYWSGFFADIGATDGATALAPIILTDEIDYDARAVVEDEEFLTEDSVIDEDAETTDDELLTEDEDLGLENQEGVIDQDEGLFQEDDLLDAETEDVGEIENLVIYPGGEVRWAILETEGFLDIFGEDLIPVPWGLLSWDAVNEEFIIGVSETRLDTAPVLDEAFIGVDFTDPALQGDLDAFWGGFLPQTGQQEQEPGFEEQDLTVTGPGSLPIFGSNLLEYGVYDVDGNSLGAVTGLMVEAGTGQIRYVLLELDNILEGGLIPVPWNAFDLIQDPDLAGVDTVDETGLDTGQDTGLDNDYGENLALQLNVDEGQLQDAPQVSEIGLADVRILGEDIVEWDPAVEDFWGNLDPELLDDEDAAQAPSAAPFIVYEGLFEGIDFDVANFDGNDLGEIEEFIVNPDGSVRWGILETDAFLDVGDELVPIAWNALNWDPEQDTFFLNVDDTFLNNAPSFDNFADFPAITGPDWDTELRSYWGDYIVEEEAALDEEEATLRDTGEADLQQELPTNTEQVMGANAVDRDGSNIGTIAELVTGQAEENNYVIVEQPDGALMPIPRGAMNWDAANQEAVYTLDPALLETAPTYSDLETFETTDGNWAMETRLFWGNWVDLSAGEEGLFGEDDAAAGEDEAVTGEDEAAGDMQAEQAEVQMVNISFQPDELTVPAGTTVVWTNDSNLPHTVTADDGSFDSGTIQSGETYEFTFDEAGEYPYYCEFHGSAGGIGMAGIITVTDQ